MPRKIVAANWKMNLVRSDALLLVQEILSNKADNISVNVVFAPSSGVNIPFSFNNGFKKIGSVRQIFVSIIPG